VGTKWDEAHLGPFLQWSQMQSFSWPLKLSVQWNTPEISSSWRQEDHKFQATLSYVTRPCLKRKQQSQQQQQKPYNCCIGWLLGSDIPGHC
jgi:hypothetical protein